MFRSEPGGAADRWWPCFCYAGCGTTLRSGIGGGSGGAQAVGVEDVGADVARTAAGGNLLAIEEKTDTGGVAGLDDDLAGGADGGVGGCDESFAGDGLTVGGDGNP